MDKITNDKVLTKMGKGEELLNTIKNEKTTISGTCDEGQKICIAANYKTEKDTR